jgi:adenylate cyclase
MAYTEPSTLSKEIAIVTIDNESIQGINQKFPWDRSIYAEAIQKINAQNPKAIAIDLLFAENGGQEEDYILGKTIRESKAPVILPMAFTYGKNVNFSETGEKIEINSQGMELPIFQTHKGFSNFPLDSDNILRRAVMEKGEYQYFGKTVFEKAYKKEAQTPKSFHINFNQKYFPQLSFIFLNMNSYPEDFFKDRIVLIGSTFTTSQDFHHTPVNPHMPGVIVIANIIETILSGEYFSMMGNTAAFIISLLFSGLLLLSFLFAQKWLKIASIFGLPLIFLSLFLFSFYNINFFISLTPLATFFIILLAFWITKIYIQKIMTKSSLEKLKSGGNDFYKKYNISPAEKDVLILAIKGFTNLQIAKKLFRSDNTVKAHLRNIRKKTNCQNRIEIISKIALGE